MGPPCAGLFSSVMLMSGKKIKISDNQGSSVPPCTASPLDTSHFLGAHTGALPAPGGDWRSQFGDKDAFKHFIIKVATRK